MRISDWSSDVCSSDLMSQSMVQMATMQRDLIYVDEKIRYLLGVADQRGPAMAALDKRLTSVERWNRIVGIAILFCTGVAGWGRSAERRDGNGSVSTCRSRWSPYHQKHNKPNNSPPNPT